MQGGAGAEGQMEIDMWYGSHTQCGWRKLMWIRNITNAKYLYHKVCSCGFGFEIPKCFFRIKALAVLGGHRDRFQSGQK